MTLCLSIEQKKTIKMLKKKKKTLNPPGFGKDHSNKNLSLKQEKMVKHYKSLLATVTLRTKTI